MNHQSEQPASKLVWATLKKNITETQRVPVTSAVVALCILGIQMSGFLQPLEWALWDQFFRWRPLEAKDKRILIVGIDEKDLQKMGLPTPDDNIADLLQTIQDLNPRAIGLDLYRSNSAKQGTKEEKQKALKLEKTLKEIPNLVAIEKIAYKGDVPIPGPEELNNKGLVGFNNVVVDSDGKVRRSLLYWHIHKNNKILLRESFALKLAAMYLKPEGYLPKPAPNTDYLQLGSAVFKQFADHDGPYVGADAGGYQILTNFRGPAGSFEKVSMSDVLNKQVKPSLFKNRIVLIGSTAPSVKDLFSTPYSTPGRVFGVELHANFISNILSAVLDRRSLITVWPQELEWLWLFLWSGLGATISWKVRSPERSALAILLAGATLTLTAYGAFLIGCWVPVVPPLMALFISAISITGYIAHLEEELKHSKEFLFSVINRIPDPIFVKNKYHRWIVLNEAYCKFIGQPYEELIDKSEAIFLSAEEAKLLWQRDEKVFQTGEEEETEEKFTDVRGNTYTIATKRSLHKDAAGNVFLVGVIRDITERKQMEEELKQTAAELARSNEELKVSKDRFRYLAYHDPLTGLANRKLFQERLSQSLEWASINNKNVALLFLDLDGFKQVNDSLGHETGDLLLKAVAGRLTGCLRGSDTISRLGGDEFTVILTAIPGIADAARVAEKILSTLAFPFEIEGNQISVTGSIGISLYPRDGQDLETLINESDMAMYRAKEAGKNRYEIAAAGDILE